MAKTSANPSVALEKTAKGGSMWELLLQMRALLPYLARLAPLVEPLIGGALVKSAPDARELHQSLTEVQTGHRNLEVQARNQALQMERIEAQLARLRVAQETAAEESRRHVEETRSLRRALITMGVILGVLVLLTAVLVSFLLIRP